jgi:hypothetical protein
VSTPETQGNANDRNLSSLGIMLLELYFGAALEDHKLCQKYVASGNTPDAFLDLAAALEWSSRAVKEAGPDFADAIQWCLCNMSGSCESDRKLER